jgi:uncharacterized protein (TIGR02231 family)
MTRFYASLLLGTSLWVSSAARGDIALPSPAVESVTIDRNGAAITRRGQVTIAAGDQTLLLRDLPSSIDADSLRLSFASTNIRLGTVEVQRQASTEFVVAQEKLLRDKIQMLEDERAAINDDMATAQLLLKTLESVSAPSTGSLGATLPAGITLQTAIDTMSAKSTAARNRIRGAQAKLRPLAAQIAQTNVDLAKVRTGEKQTVDLRVVLNAVETTTTAFNVEYRSREASWRPAYQVRLDSATHKLSLVQQAVVEQGSGEDWRNITLTLNTSRPSGDFTAPELTSEFLQLENPEPPPPVQASAPAPALYRREKAQDASLMEDVVVTAKRVEANTTAYATDYRIPGRVTLAADRQERVFPLAEQSFTVDLVARIVPRQSNEAFLEARFRYDAETPLLGGKMQVIRDGAFVGEANVATLLPGNDIRLPLGTDDRIKLMSRDEPGKSGERGMIGKKQLRDFRRRFEVTSFHASDVAVELLDRQPVSRDGDIKVTIPKTATKATSIDADGKSGLMLWRFNATPRVPVVIAHHLQIEWPASRNLLEEEE